MATLLKPKKPVAKINTKHSLLKAFGAVNDQGLKIKIQNREDLRKR
ncbi:MAG: hypothetical protein LC122_00895 [Chitinophagales bacterium]|nr:hypothetical protein [Chitinophagales bacterium]